MVSSPSPSERAALTVIQQAVSLLCKWSGAGLDAPPDTPEIQKVKEYLSWPADGEPRRLRSLFDSIRLSTEEYSPKKHDWRPRKLENSYPVIPYPIPAKNTSGTLTEDLDLLLLQQQIREELSFLENNSEDWNNLSLLTLILEKYGSFLSFGEANVALIDKARVTAAVAASIASFSEPPSLCLIVGDLSGIQNFIYTISSDGALKSLRARSFYLELVTEEVVQQILNALDLPRVNVIYAGGGNLYILAPETKQTKKIIRQIRIQFNAWLLEKFQGKVYLALDSSEPFPLDNIADKKDEKFADHWTKATKNLSVYKSRKFGDRLEDLQSLIQPRYAHTPCGVCHRDDESDLKPLSRDSEVQACSTCREMYELGRTLFKVEVIARSSDKAATQNPIIIKLPKIEDRNATTIYYDLFERWESIEVQPDTVLLVNDWDLEHYRYFPNSLPLLLGNYPQKPYSVKLVRMFAFVFLIQSGISRLASLLFEDYPKRDNFMSAGEMAEKSDGIKRMGYLRMDVDRLGQIFARGLRDNRNTEERSGYLPKLAGLSRQMSYFFKVYLNSLANARAENIPENIKQLARESPIDLASIDGPDTPPRILLFIYAGGDDLFISGAWNAIVDFAFDVYQSFRAYTGYNREITLSGGISIAEVKFPLYQAAKESGEAEEAAKSNGRDSLGLFGEVFKWDEWLGGEIDEWLGGEILESVSSEIRDYLTEENSPHLFGIMPFVERLEREKIGIDYARSFVRNLLLTAQIQKQELDKFKKTEQHSEEARGTRYFLHLPKVAYTLSRLPKGVLEDDKFRQSLKNPYNAPYFQAIATWIELLNRSE